jgi:hypothetical protein
MEIAETTIFTREITRILCDEENSLILMIYVYEKSKTSDLTPKQIEMLRKTFMGGL